ncbi:MAG: GatB/YqeY domain-containing protein [Enterococcus sp.]|nr:GatB/YqeY domain-containing protein [Enterococcus sp.]
MTLLSTLNDDMKQAMKAKEKDVLQVIRMIKASLQNEQIKLGRELTEEEDLTILAREMKQRRDSLAEFEKAHRDDLVEKVKIEIAIVERYLPAQLTEDEIRQIVLQAIEQTNATSSQSFGPVMGLVMPQVKGKADGALVNAVVKELLNNL